VDERSFLVLPHSGAFSLEIAERHAVGLCCAYFKHGFVESVHSAMLAKDLEPGVPLRLDLLAHIHPRDARISARMGQMANSETVEDDALRTGEQFTLLARDLILLDRATNKALNSLPGFKPATREELFRRICRGRDFIHAEAFGTLRIDEIASAACLSPFHFHRAFTKAFGIAPHKYVTRLRIEKAAELLTAHRELTVLAIAQKVGFKSVTSFSSLFRRHLGVSPLGFRIC
jgi:AraC family transcriptional regulator